MFKIILTLLFLFCIMFNLTKHYEINIVKTNNKKKDTDVDKNMNVDKKDVDTNVDTEVDKNVDVDTEVKKTNVNNTVDIDTKVDNKVNVDNSENNTSSTKKHVENSQIHKMNNKDLFNTDIANKDLFNTDIVNKDLFNTDNEYDIKNSNHNNIIMIKPEENSTTNLYLFSSSNDIDKSVDKLSLRQIEINDEFNSQIVCPGLDVKAIENIYCGNHIEEYESSIELKILYYSIENARIENIKKIH